MFCEACGFNFSDGASFCSGCGRPRPAFLPAPQQVGISAPPAPTQWASQPTATLTPPHQFAVSHGAGNGFSTAGIILGAIAFLFFPIVLGPTGLILAAVGKSKGEDKAVVAMTVAGLGTVIGMILGVMLFSV
jgi:hypothetical protein